MTEHTPERRETPRVPVAARVKFREGDREEVWFTEDLSEGGLFLKTEKPPFVGVILDLDISLPEMENLIRLRGEVVWRHEGRGCGVRFLRVTAATRKTLRSFIDSVQESA